MPSEAKRPVLLSSHKMYSLAINTGPYTNVFHYSSVYNNNREKNAALQLNGLLHYPCAKMTPDTMEHQGMLHDTCFLTYIPCSYITYTRV